MRHKRHKRPVTALEALRDVMATGWQSDAMAKDAAIQAMVLDGYNPEAAAMAVDAAFAKHFAIMGAV